MLVRELGDECRSVFGASAADRALANVARKAPVSFSSVPYLVSTVPFPMTPPYVGRDVTFFLNQARILSR